MRALVHDRHGVGHGHGLLLVVGHVEEGQADLLLDRLQLELHLTAQLEVERSERLVEQQERRTVDDRPSEGDALLLAARELGRPPLREVVEFDEAERLVGLALRVVDPPALQPERHVVDDRHVREQGVALEDRVDRAFVRTGVGDVASSDEDATLRRLLEPRHEAERRGLAATRRAEQGEEGSGRDREVEFLDRGEPGEALLDADQFEVCASFGEFANRHGQDPSRIRWNSAWYFCSSAGVSVRKMLDCDSVSSLGKISWLSASAGSIAIAASLAPTTGVM